MLLLASCDWYVPPALLRKVKDRDEDGFLADQAGGDDCDDADPLVSPAAREVCSDGRDNDCNGIFDDFGEGEITWYLDQDGDGYGELLTSRMACPDHLNGTDWAPRTGDCDDTDPQVNPGVEDADCDGRDENCDGVPDDEAENITWYRDADQDTYGDAGDTVMGCKAPEGYAARDGDCDDGDPLRHPGAVEVCDEIDNDCVGGVDDGLALYDLWADGDGDGLGDPAVFAPYCAETRDSYTDNSLDCDDSDASLGELFWYPDADGDCHGDPVGEVSQCVSPLPGVTCGGWVLAPDGDDCDDTTELVAPGLAEVCNDGLDNNCDLADTCTYAGVIALSSDAAMLPQQAFPEGASATFVPDVDGDGFPEVAVGYWDADTSSGAAAGLVELYASPFVAGTAVTAAPVVTFNGAYVDGHAGARLSAAEDLTGDGVPDIIVSAPDANSGKGTVALADASRLGAWGLNATPLQAVRELVGTTSGSQLGGGVVARDVPAVGASALLAVAPGADSAYVVHAPIFDLSIRIELVADAVLEAPGAELIAPMGDVSGDGVPELGVAYWDAGVGVGYFDVVSGTVSGTVVLDTSHDYRVETSASPGFAAAAAGDVDGDGTADWLMAAPKADVNSGGTTVAEAGRAFLLLGPQPALSDAGVDAATIVEGTNAGQLLGSAVLLLDLTGDGLDDLVIGAPGSGGIPGELLLFHGAPPMGLLSAGDHDALFIPGSVSVAALGVTLQSIGDANGDGLADVVAAAAGSGSAGALDPTAFIIFGRGL